MIDAADLPDDVAALKAMIIASDGREQRHQDRIVRLEKLVADFRRVLFGSKSERVDPDQFELALEDIEAATEAIKQKRKPTTSRQQANPVRAKPIVDRCPSTCRVSKR